MKILKGKTLFEGICIGTIYYYKKQKTEVKRIRIEDTQAELKRYQKAKEQIKTELEEFFQVNQEKRTDSIVEILKILLENQEFIHSIENIILNKKVNAEYAVTITSDHLTSSLAAFNDSVSEKKIVVIQKISERMLTILSGEKVKTQKMEKPVIVVAEELTPIEIARLEKEKILGFLSPYGTINSHTSILAKTMGVPIIIAAGKELDETCDGKMAVADGFTGIIYLEPDENILMEMKQKQKQMQEKNQLLGQLRGKENKTLDGRSIDIHANIGTLSDLDTVLEQDAGGIGLFRSEFLYLEHGNYPSEEEQFAAYKKALTVMNGRKVIIRTLDIGADKKVKYFKLPKEENPALGFRAIRVCLERKDIFKTQLRALFRASVYGNLSILFPLITFVEEVKKIKELIQQVKQELETEGIKYQDKIELGIMIETPAAVMMSKELAKEVDFFSVGTNDLTQYTFAVDRQNPTLLDYYNPNHPVILRLLEITIKNAHEQGIWVGICGEMAGDFTMTETLLNMGFDELSVSPKLILSLRKKIRSIEG